MTTQYVYTSEEHNEAEINRIIVKKLEKCIEKGLMIEGKLVKDVRDFIFRTTILHGQ